MNSATKSRDEVLNQLAKLKRHEECARNLGSIAEANAFALRIATILEKHMLEMVDIDLAGGDTGEALGELFTPFDRTHLGNSRRRVAWVERLASLLCKETGCSYLVTSGSNAIHLVGKPAQRKLAQYLLESLVHFASFNSEEDRKKARTHVETQEDFNDMRGYRQSWITGFIDELDQRFEERRAEAFNTPTGVALMRIDNDCALSRKWVKEEYGCGSARATKRQTGHSASGYAQGKRQARNANINRGVGSGASRGRIG